MVGLDHPRSRGVYIPCIQLKRSVQGSSPLARGLPGMGAGTFPHARIIPARAGFTSLREVRQEYGRDHPRSRGVYMSSSCRSWVGWGSSPLARGLRASAYDAHTKMRIIPARAGFTFRITFCGGCMRIIPARAGFTCSPPPWRSGTPDHPRSRGVYLFVMTSRAVEAGSSPLARGLPRSAPESLKAIRIIPARAGFTTARPASYRLPSDHPRSRGVYRPPR